MKKIIVLIGVIILIISCTYHRKIPTYDRFQKLTTGTIPRGANVIIIREFEKDTLWARFNFRGGVKYYGGIRENYTGDFYIIRKSNLDNLRFKTKVVNGRYHGDAYVYYDSGKILRQYFINHGSILHGYSVDYYSNGFISGIECYCNYKKVGIWSYYDENGELLKVEDYGQIPDTCQIPNQYLYDSLPEKYKNVREAFISPLDK